MRRNASDIIRTYKDYRAGHLLEPSFSWFVDLSSDLCWFADLSPDFNTPEFVDLSPDPCGFVDLSPDLSLFILLDIFLFSPIS